MSNVPSADTDPWDRPLTDIGGKAVSTSHKAAASSGTIPDDWDEASSEEEDNQRIWDNANKKVPMPQVVVTSSRAGTAIPSVVPPASAFQPPIRILKRSVTSTQNCPNDDSSTSASAETSLAERAARYDAARERIFGGTTEASAEGSREGVPVSVVIRNPKGPEHVQGLDKEGSQGFGVRAGKRGSPGQKQVQQPQDSDAMAES